MGGLGASGRGPIRVILSVLTIMPSAVFLTATWSVAFCQAKDAAQTPHLELTLDDTIRLALQNNRSLIDARATRTLQELSLEVSESRYWPTASIGGSARKQNEHDLTVDGSVETMLRIPTGGQFLLRWSKPFDGYEDPSSTVSLGFSQPLLRGFGVDIDTAPLRVARLRDRIGFLSFNDAIAGVVVSTIHAWRNLVRAGRQLKIAEASLERAREQFVINRKLIEAGQMAEREILQSEAAIADQELRLVETRNQVIAANFGLIDVLDIDGVTTIEPLEEPRSRRPTPDPEESIAAAIRHSPGYASALLAKEIAAIDLEVAENEALWDLSLDLQASKFGGGRSTDNSAGVRLMIPLWEPSLRLRVTSSRTNLRKIERGLAELRQSMGIRVRQAVHDVQMGLRRIELAREARSLAEQKLDIERRKLQQGLSSTFQLSQFEQDLVRAQNAEVEAVVGYENALTSLDRLLGATLDTWNIRIERVGR